MTFSKAYVDTTVLSDALLKQNPKGEAARFALRMYPETLLPVYAIKEFKAGPLNYWIWLHNKLVATGSLVSTLEAINSITGFQLNRARTALEALTSMMRSLGGTPLTDNEAADLYRLCIARLIIAVWKKRRTITTRVTDELTCYTEAAPQLSKKTARFENPSVNCKLYGTEECCMATSLKGRPEDLESLLLAMRGMTRREDKNRRGVLRKLRNTPKRAMNAWDCRRLGDAFFALYSPAEAVILTTNIKDHKVLAEALNKQVTEP